MTSALLKLKHPRLDLFLAIGSLVWLASFTQGVAQPIDVDTPTGRIPKTLESDPVEANSLLAPPRIRSPRAPEGGNESLHPGIPDLTIQGLIFVNSEQEIALEGADVPANGVEVRLIPLLDTPDFIARMRNYLGQPFTENRIRDIQDEVILYCRERNRPLVDVLLTTQSITNGVAQFWFLEGIVGKISVENSGRHYFSDSTIKRSIRVKPGETVDSRRLTEDLLWLNRNPFRSVGILYSQGDELGTSDLVLEVKDRLPLRIYTGYENSGTIFTGKDRVYAGFNYGNLWGRDHQLNYQFTSDYQFDLIEAHSASYVLPLPWRHTLNFSGAYVDATLDDDNVTSEADGQSVLGSIRYQAPLKEIFDTQQELTLGFDYKRSDNDLEFGGAQQAPRDYEVLQFQAGYSILKMDNWGQTTLGLEGFYSPGDLTDLNSDSSFDALRPDSSADYLYGRLSFERVNQLPGEFLWILTAVGQYSSDRLISSEEFGVGGYRSVRGYPERFANGDNGWIVSNEIRSPGFKLWNFFPGGQNAIQFLAFVDYGAVRIIGQSQNDDFDADLLSVGGGLRYTVGKHISVRADYGVQLRGDELKSTSGQDNPLADEGEHMAHVGVVLSF